MINVKRKRKRVTVEDALCEQVWERRFSEKTCRIGFYFAVISTVEGGGLYSLSVPFTLSERLFRVQNTKSSTNI